MGRPSEKGSHGAAVTTQAFDDRSPAENRPIDSSILRSIWHPESLNNVDSTILPPTRLLNDALAQLIIALNSPSHNLEDPNGDKSTTKGSALVLYCPLEGGENIIDAAVKELGRRTSSQIQVFDIARLVDVLGQLDNSWNGLFEFAYSKTCVPHNLSQAFSAEESGSQVWDHIIEDILNSVPPGLPDVVCVSGNCPRLIYIRDAGLAASFTPAFYSALLTNIHTRLGRAGGSKSSPELSAAPTAVILGVSSPLANHRHTPEGFTFFDSQASLELPGDSDECDSAEQSREYRLKEKFEMWNGGTIFNRIHQELAKASILLGPGEKHLPILKNASICVIVPAKRNLERERESRERRRLEVNQFHAHRALSAIGGKLRVGIDPFKEIDQLTQACRRQLIPYDVFQCLANQALGTAIASSTCIKLCGSSRGSRITITWGDLWAAWESQTEMLQERSQWLQNSLIPERAESPEVEPSETVAAHDITLEFDSGTASAPQVVQDSGQEVDEDRPPLNSDKAPSSNGNDTDTSSSSSEDSDSDSDSDNSDLREFMARMAEQEDMGGWPRKKKQRDDGQEEESDEVIKRVKKMRLDRYESRMLQCIVRPAQIQAGFDVVHLPADTIDIVRTLVSLPLICPEQFQTGILKQHSMTGALLFGPPGTGKTLVARAIAKESGSRMISVKPSDIQEKCVGESEKIISGLFQLARRLKPCIIFIDEIDALLGARTYQKESNSAHWHTTMLTQFMQEMDGMFASDVVVIGTTNRPFDLDDAVIRRLPCRVFVDLPDEAAREVILRILLKDEILGDDVDLAALAAQTKRFSGSDLKHLCVMTAYESVKDSAREKVPWNVQSHVQPDPPKWEASSGLKSSCPLKPSADCGSHSTQSACTSAPTSEPSEYAFPEPCMSDKIVTLEPPHRSDTVRPTPSTTVPPSILPMGTGSSSAVLVEEPDSLKNCQGRKLSKPHFSRALVYVRASATEAQVSIRELNRWNKQFGSGRQCKRGECPPSNLENDQKDDSLPAGTGGDETESTSADHTTGESDCSDTFPSFGGAGGKKKAKGTIARWLERNHTPATRSSGGPSTCQSSGC